MGRLIDCNDVYNAIQITTDNFGVAKRVVEDNMLTMLSKIETVEAIPKDQYEARLKADLKAILVELKLEIEEIPYYHGTYVDVDYIDREKVIHKIQQKGNALKENTDGNI